MNEEIPPVTEESIRAAKEAAQRERDEINAGLARDKKLWRIRHDGIATMDKHEMWQIDYARNMRGVHPPTVTH